ncbi:MAG: hypothetical protein U0935_02395 [Pirellulales bacterium]
MSSLRLFVVALLVGAAALCGGCAPKLPPVADPERAKQALQTALEAWKNGETIESLTKRTPAIYFNEEVWQGGQTLLKYELQEDRASGRGWLFDVKMTFPSNPNSPRVFHYLVDTEPAIVIVQQP